LTNQQRDAEAKRLQQIEAEERKRKAKEADEQRRREQLKRQTRDDRT
jgi:hypothetical protein